MVNDDASRLTNRKEIKMPSAGSRPFSNAAVSNEAQLVANHAAGLVGYHILNPNANYSYVFLYDAAAAASVTPGTTTPKMVLGFPSSGGGTRGITPPVRFTNGIVISASNAANGTGAPFANQVVEIEYRR